MLAIIKKMLCSLILICILLGTTTAYATVYSPIIGPRNSNDPIMMDTLVYDEIGDDLKIAEIRIILDEYPIKQVLFDDSNKVISIVTSHKGILRYKFVSDDNYRSAKMLAMQSEYSKHTTVVIIVTALSIILVAVAAIFGLAYWNW